MRLRTALPITTGSSMGRFTFILLCLVASACASQPHTTDKGTTHVIHISNRVLPDELIASIGDEIRWNNESSKPVAVGLLESKWLDGVTCESGFRGLWRIDDIVTVKPGHSVSLCFARTGTVQYNVWLDADNMRSSMSPTAVIHVRERAMLAN